MILRLAYTPPYDWPALLGFLAARAIPGVEAAQAGAYARTFRAGAEYGVVTVQPEPGENALRATIRGPAPPDIVARLRGLFDLDAEPASIARHLSADPHLAPLVAARPGLRVPGAWDGFELAVRATLGQQITVGAASGLAGKLAAAFGTPVPPGGGLSCVFPTAERLPGADIAATLGMPRARAAAIASLAADPSVLAPGQGLSTAVTRLCELPGIGAWTAQYIAMRALREPDAFPAADIGLLRAMATPAGRPTPAQLLARAAAWRPWRAYAAMHLWTSAQVGPVAVAAE